ncbi:MAG: hypothetical protein ACTHW2_11025 [Tissierella sp.]
MPKDLKENFRDISSENKSREDSKITSFDIIMGKSQDLNFETYLLFIKI